MRVLEQIKTHLLDRAIHPKLFRINFFLNLITKWINKLTKAITTQVIFNNNYNINNNNNNIYLNYNNSNNNHFVVILITTIIRII